MVLAANSISALIFVRKRSIPMKLASFVRKLSSTRKRAFRGLLNSLSALNPVYQQMIRNLAAECTFSIRDWEELRRIVEAHRTDHLGMANRIRAFCRNGRVLRGRIIVVKSETVFGRVKPFDDFCDSIRKLHHWTMDDTRNLVLARIGTPASARDPVWDTVQLAQYSMWATFRPGSRKPFGRILPSARRLLCLMGLDLVAGPLLVFQYSLTADNPPRIPTYCDAYAMSDWSPYFYRVDDKASCGMTMPPPSCRLRNGRPEAVHAAIHAKQLTEPLEFAPAGVAYGKSH